MDLNTLHILIARQGTLEQVSLFLKERGLPHSGGSWSAMTSRLKRLHEIGQLTDADLLEILRRTEEYGSQHIFLFEKVPTASIDSIFKADLSKALADRGLPALDEAVVLDMPNVATVTEVRRGQLESVDTVIFKIVERRHTYENDEKAYPDGRIVVTKNPLPYRSVSILRISADGLADLRISSNSDVVSYEGFSNTIWNALSPIVNKADWRGTPLNGLKTRLLDPAHRDTISELFNLRHSQHTNLEGMRLTAASPTPFSSIYNNARTIGSLDHFNSVANDAYCDRIGVILRGNDESNIRDIAINLNGEENEFSVSRKVTESEYERILWTIRQHNQ